MYLRTHSFKASATPDPLPCVKTRMPCVRGLLGLDQGLLWNPLVVEGDDFELLAVHSACGVDVFGNEAERIQADFADRRVASGKGIDEGDLGCVLQRCRAAKPMRAAAANAILVFMRNSLPCKRRDLEARVGFSPKRTAPSAKRTAPTYRFERGPRRRGERGPPHSLLTKCVGEPTHQFDHLIVLAPSLR